MHVRLCGGWLRSRPPVGVSGWPEAFVMGGLVIDSPAAGVGITN